MPSSQSNGHNPIILHTPRLTLRMADPDIDADCEAIIRLANDPEAGKGGNSECGYDSIPNVRKKHKLMGPKAEYCTLAPPPRGMWFLVFLPSETAGAEEEGELISMICLTFRPEMPYPDLGYGTLGPYQKQGYTSEAGRRVLQFWQEEIGVKEIWVGTFPDNEKSQKCAERMGFVRGGTVTAVFQPEGQEEKRVEGCVGLILPGMKWKEGITIYPTVG